MRLPARRFRPLRTAGQAALCVLVAAGCTPSALEGGFDSPVPGAKLNAIRRAGIERDRDAIPHLIEQLDSDDPGVRMFAIGALDRITGTRLGYVHYDPVSKRREAIERWRRAYDDGQLGPVGSADASQ